MVRLNLPPFEYRISDDGPKIRIFDVIRKKFVALTPEEWVRQHFVHFLINQKKYPRSLIKIEGGLLYNQLHKRTDIVVHDRHGSPWLVIECKRPDQQINERVLAQVATYNTVSQARFLAVTNGLQHFYFRTDWENKLTTSLKEIPEFDRN